MKTSLSLIVATRETKIRSDLKVIHQMITFICYVSLPN